MSILKVDELQSRTSGNRITLPDVNNYPPYRNLIINGDMSIAQRGTSATSVSSSGYHSLDRFRFGFNETDELVATISQDTDVPSGQGFANSMKFEVTTPETTLATDEILQIVHRMEGQNTQNLKYGTSSAESLTLSFWVKSSITGTYVITFKNNDPSAGTRLNVNTYTINSANTWEKKTITITGDTTANTNFVNTNAKGLELNWCLAAGGSYQGTSSSGWTSYGAEKLFNGQSANVITTSGATWLITGVQLEVGKFATPFEFLPYDVNLQRCFRYYELLAAGYAKMLGFGGAYNANTPAFVSYYHPKRTTPSIDQTSGAGYYRIYGNGVEYTWSAYSALFQASTTQAMLLGSGTIPQGLIGLFDTISGSSYIAYDAEL